MRWKRGNRLRLIGEGDAPPSTREIFDEVRHSLGVPSVPVLYRAYAAFPQFLEYHWEVFRPAVQSRQFFSLGARLAAESYTRAHAYLGIDSLTMCDMVSQADPHLPVAQVLDYYQYLDPLLLLISSAQMQAFEGVVGHAGAAEVPIHPTFQVAPELVADEEASAPVQRIWTERRRLLEVAFVSDEHRALARWPQFYREYWASLRTSVGSPLYSDCQYRIGESAWTMVRELPVRLETSVSQVLDHGMDGEGLSSLVRINEAFMQAMTGLVLDVTFARIACDGGTRAQSPPLKASSSVPTKKKVKSPTKAA
jgi:halocarboxylic acid dehydrogenase DehI